MEYKIEAYNGGHYVRAFTNNGRDAIELYNILTNHYPVVRLSQRASKTVRYKIISNYDSRF